MGFGWIRLCDDTPPLIFHGNTILSPSSTKAECFAILTALLICPPNSSVTIYTDSANCINTFDRINNTLTSSRQLLKIPNHQIWRLIKDIIRKNSITVSFKKVKAHSGNEYNDLADAEAKKGLDIPPIMINPKYIPDALMVIPWVRYIETSESLPRILQTPKSSIHSAII